MVQDYVSRPNVSLMVRSSLDIRISDKMLQKMLSLDQ